MPKRADRADERVGISDDPQTDEIMGNALRWTLGEFAYRGA